MGTVVVVLDNNHWIVDENCLLPLCFLKFNRTDILLHITDETEHMADFLWYRIRVEMKIICCSGLIITNGSPCAVSENKNAVLITPSKIFYRRNVRFPPLDINQRTIGQTTATMTDVNERNNKEQFVLFEMRRRGGGGGKTTTTYQIYW